jgi:hypothetical protein
MAQIALSEPVRSARTARKTLDNARRIGELAVAAMAVRSREDDAMDGDSGVAGLAALAICESMLLSLTENKLIDDHEARAILKDAAAAHRSAIPLAADARTTRPLPF